MVKYIKEDWPEYQAFMERPDFRERCFYCADDNSYFIPEDLYDGGNGRENVSCRTRYREINCK